MEIFDILVIAFNIFAVVYAIIRKKTGIYLNKNTYEIEGNGVFYTGLAGIIFLVAIIIISPLGGYTVGFLCFNLMGLYMIYRWGCTRIIFFEDHIRVFGMAITFIILLITRKIGDASFYFTIKWYIYSITKGSTTIINIRTKKLRWE